MILAGFVSLAALGRANGSAPIPFLPEEHYSYTAFDAKQPDVIRETIDAHLSTSNTTTFCRSTTHRPFKTETMVLELAGNGWIRRAEKSSISSNKSAITRWTIIPQGNSVSMERRIGDKIKTVSDDYPTNMPLVVDSSLVLLTRHMLAAGNKTQAVFVADFSQHTIGVHIQTLTNESVTVPAGTFICTKVMATLNIPLFRPTITFWLASAPPYFLVKHIGRRGPFMPLLTSVLTSCSPDGGKP